MNAKEIGEQAYVTLRNDRLEADLRKVKFHDPKKTERVKSFISLSKKERGEIKWTSSHLES
jgi:hypothetical protein